MLTSLIAISYLFLLTWELALVSGKRAEDCLPAGICGLGLWLYVFYCLGAVRWGLGLFCLGLPVLLLLTVRRYGGLRAAANKLAVPGMAVYAGLCVLFLAVLSGNTVTFHDELRLWAAVPKAIHSLGTLQLGPESPIFPTMQSYPPAQPLLTWFFTAFSPSFREGALFAAYACLTEAFLIPALSGWDRSRCSLLAPAGLALLLVPCFFTSHYGDGCLFGMSLFVDPFLGVVVGYAFCLAGRKPFRDPFRLAAFSLSLCLLGLCKDTGVGFAAMALICALILDPAALRGRGLYPAAGLIIGGGSWRLLLRLKGVHALISLGDRGLSPEGIRNVLRALVTENVAAYKLGGVIFSFAAVFLALCLLYVWVNRKRGASAWVIGGGLLVCVAAFLVGYAAVYGRTMESYPRYMTTLLLGCFSCFLPELLEAVSARPADWLAARKPAFRLVSGLTCLLLAAVFFLAWCRVIFTPLGFREEADADAGRISAAVTADLDPGETGRVYMVMAGDGIDNSLYAHRIFFTSLSDRMWLKNTLGDTRVTDLPDPVGDWTRTLQSCSHVYILTLEEKLAPIFAAFSQDPPAAGGLYRVCPQESGVILKRVS